MTKPRTAQKELFGRAFLYALGLSVLIFLPFVIMDKGYFFFFGDFNVQQIPFYKLAHEAIRSGDIYWNWYTDLGANFIGSYAFYLLGSPFFWLTLPFPTSFVPYLMAPLFCLKFATASLTGYAYITRFVKNKNYALLGGLLYAFSGFSLYNIFFNHFHECIAFFPLLLIGLEEYMTKGKRGIFALAVFINALVNYFFFVGEVVFLIIYFVFRLKTGGFQLTKRRFFTLAFESVVGFGMACILLVPAAVAILDNPRLGEYPNGWGAVLYNSVQRYPQIIQAFFFPPELPSRPSFFPDANVKWSSVAGWLPFVSMTGAISYVLAKKKSFITKILGTCLIFAMVPFLNSAFYAFNASYYARWFYMPVLMLALASVIAFENQEIFLQKGLQYNANITLLFIIFIGLMPNSDDNGNLIFGLMDYPDRFWAYSAIVVACIFLIFYAYKKFGRSKRFQQFLMVGTMVTALGCSWLFIAMGKAHSYSTDYLIDQALDARDNWDLPEDLDIEDQFYRVDIYKGMDNLGMYWHMPTIQTFHSVVPGSVMEFYPTIGVTRDVGSRAEMSHWALRPLTSVKFLFARQENKVENPGEDYVGAYEGFGFEYYDTQNGFDIYRNEYYIPMGFTYEYYMDEFEFMKLDEGRRENALLGAIYLTDEQIDKYGVLYQPADMTELRSLKEEELAEMAMERKLGAAYYFAYDNKGFTAKIVTERSQLVVFSVPYEAGWTATVDGQPVPVEKVNAGFMAVPVEMGDVEIRFEYRTPGLTLGIGITIVSILLYGLYILLSRRGILKEEERPLVYEGYEEEWDFADTNAPFDPEEDVLDDKPKVIEIEGGIPVDKLSQDTPGLWDDVREEVETGEPKEFVFREDEPYDTPIEDMPEGEFHEGFPDLEADLSGGEARGIVNDIIDTMDDMRHMSKDQYKEPPLDE